MYVCMYVWSLIGSDSLRHENTARELRREHIQSSDIMFVTMGWTFGYTFPMPIRLITVSLQVASETYTFMNTPRRRVLDRNSQYLILTKRSSLLFHCDRGIYTHKRRVLDVHVHSWYLVLTRRSCLLYLGLNCVSLWIKNIIDLWLLPGDVLWIFWSWQSLRVSCPLTMSNILIEQLPWYNLDNLPEHLVSHRKQNNGNNPFSAWTDFIRQNLTLKSIPAVKE